MYVRIVETGCAQVHHIRSRAKNNGQTRVNDYDHPEWMLVELDDA
jgi:hypothetical protein